MDPSSADKVTVCAVVNAPAATDAVGVDKVWLIIYVPEYTGLLP